MSNTLRSPEDKGRLTWFKRMLLVSVASVAILGVVTYPIDQTKRQVSSFSDLGTQLAYTLECAASAVSEESEACVVSKGGAAAIGVVVVLAAGLYFLQSGGGKKSPKGELDKVNKALGGKDKSKDQKKSMDSSPEGYELDHPGIFLVDGGAIEATYYGLPGQVPACSPIPCESSSVTEVPATMSGFLTMDINQEIDSDYTFTPDDIYDPEGDGTYSGDIDVAYNSFMEIVDYLGPNVDHFVWSSVHERRILLGTLPNEDFDIEIELVSVNTYMHDLALTDGSVSYGVALIEVDNNDVEHVLWRWHVDLEASDMPSYDTLPSGWSPTTASGSFEMTNASHTVNVNVGSDGFGDYRVRYFTEIVAW